MAKCRNCKKEVEVDATICPYCHTSYPANEHIANIKSIVIGIIVLFVFVALIIGFISTVFNTIFTPGFLAFGLRVILSIIGIIAGGAAVGCFTNAKKWANDVVSVKDYIIFGLVCTGISLILLFIAFASAFATLF